MRLLGIVLVLIGALMLGYQGFGQAGDEPGMAQQDRSARMDAPVPVRTGTILGGIAITAGLIMVTVGEKDDE
jgi:hypothetical protein